MKTNLTTPISATLAAVAPIILAYPNNYLCRNHWLVLYILLLVILINLTPPSYFFHFPQKETINKKYLLPLILNFINEFVWNYLCITWNAFLRVNILHSWTFKALVFSLNSSIFLSILNVLSLTTYLSFFSYFHILFMNTSSFIFS